jgi:hypothetical protein
VLRRGFDRLEQSPRPPQPAARHRHRAAKVELIGRKPGGHPRRARALPAPAVEAVGALARVKYRLRVIEPPRSPTQPFEGLRRLLASESIRKQGTGGRPLSVGEPSAAGRKRVGRDALRCLCHRGHSRASTLPGRRRVRVGERFPIARRASPDARSGRDPAVPDGEPPACACPVRSKPELTRGLNARSSSFARAGRVRRRRLLLRGRTVSQAPG